MDELRPELLAPKRRRIAALAFASGIAGIAIGYIATPTEVEVVQRPPVIKKQLVLFQVPTPVVIQLPPSPRSSELSLIFKVGATTYAKITSDDTLPKHGKRRLIDDDGVQVAIATVARADLSETYHNWIDRKLVLDTGCTAKVTGFEIVSRVTGSPGYLEQGDEGWTVKNVWENGSTVLAAKLDGCDGAYARDAGLPAVVELESIEDRDDLVAKARALLITSAPAREAQNAWRTEYGQSGNWYDEEGTFKTHVMRHPKNGTIWVSVHAYNEMRCGDPGGNVWGLYRVDSYGGLTPMHVRAMNLENIENIIDIEGDGQLELIGTEWLATDRRVMRADGETLQSIGVAFFGCGC